MNARIALSRLSALSQETRLAVFRLLVRRGPEGLPAGEIGSRLGVAPNSLSFHLKALAQAGLLKSRQEGRFLYYAPDFKAMDALVGYLTDHCCADGTTGAACR